MFSALPVRAAAVAAVSSALGVAALAYSPSASAWDVSVWDKVADCESTGRWSINTGNGYYGGLQFTVSTWNEFGGRTFADRADHATKSEQIAIARRVLYTQGPQAWPVCSLRAGLTKSNGGADPSAMPSSTSSQPSSTPTSSASATATPKATSTATKPAPTPSAPSASASTIDYKRDILDVDGVLGPLTITEMQKWTGAVADGIWGPQTSRKLQGKVGADITGERDEQTTEAVQDYVGADVDGIWGRQTTSYLQRFLNER